MFNAGDMVTVTKIVPKEQDLQLHNITSECFGHILTAIMQRENGTDFLVSDNGNMYYIPSELLKKVEEDVEKEKYEKITSRKIIQISTPLSYPSTSRTVIYALCNDGTLWYKDHNDKSWLRDTDIPQY